MKKPYTYLGCGEGTNYQWENDHTFVKVSSEDTGGAYTLMEDNLKATFALGLHKHETHAETFYILEGAVDFFIDGEWFTATSGSTIHIPPTIPHACKISNNQPAKMLMIYQPSGFDLFLKEMSQMSAGDFDNKELMDAFFQRYDIVQLGPVPGSE